MGAEIEVWKPELRNIAKLISNSEVRINRKDVGLRFVLHHV